MQAGSDRTIRDSSWLMQVVISLIVVPLSAMAIITGLFKSVPIPVIVFVGVIELIWTVNCYLSYRLNVVVVSDSGVTSKKVIGKQKFVAWADISGFSYKRYGRGRGKVLIQLKSSQGPLSTQQQIHATGEPFHDSLLITSAMDIAKILTEELARRTGTALAESPLPSNQYSNPVS